RRMADARLVVLVVRPPQGGELAEQIGAFVGEFCRSHPVGGFRPGFFTDLEKLVADAVDRVIPGGALALAVDGCHGVFQAAGRDASATAAWCTVSCCGLDAAGRFWVVGLGGLDRSELEHAQRGDASGSETGATQECSPLHGGRRQAAGESLQARALCLSTLAL